MGLASSTNAADAYDRLSTASIVFSKLEVKPLIHKRDAAVYRCVTVINCFIRKLDMSNPKKKYIVCIEEQEYDWDKPEISYEEIVNLGGWESSAGIIEIDKDQNEHTLQPGAVIELKPGHGFSKKICWKRGLDIFEMRLNEELNLLRSRFNELEYVENGRWVLLPNYLSEDGWLPSAGPVAFQMPDSPTAPPYAFYTPSGIRFNGVMPTNYQDQVSIAVPFSGKWGVFSWSPDGPWVAGATVRSGSNMLNWAMGFRSRFKQGA